jgi:hypothetical protein
VIRGAAYYEEKYVRLPEGWRIAYLTYTRIYETMESMDDTPSLKFLAGV